MAIINEIWKDIKGYEGYYQISNIGNVKSLDRITIDKNGTKRKRTGNLMVQNFRSGYKNVGLTKNGIKTDWRIHRLVAISFLPEPMEKTDVNHIDGDKLNNSVENLEWTTHKENMQHALNYGLYKRGSNHGSSKLKEEDIRFIRANVKRNGGSYNQAELAIKFGVSKDNIRHIVKNKSWKHVI